MKKIILVIIVVITTLTSCGKDYTCTCYITGGAYHSTSYVSAVYTYHTTKSNALKQCATKSINGQNCSIN